MYNPKCNIGDLIISQVDSPNINQFIIIAAIFDTENKNWVYKCVRDLSTNQIEVIHEEFIDYNLTKKSFL